MIPDDNVNILLKAATYLVDHHLFKIHNITTPGQSGIGWEVISEQRAGSFQDLTRDESIIFQIIDSAGTAGMWTKIIKSKSGVPSKQADKVFKTLENKKRIKSMKSVRFPQRKMYIVAGLTPSEEATGGAWFTDGSLDEGLINAVADAIETFVSRRSWRECDLSTSESVSGTKRKRPDNGFDIRGKSNAKIVGIDDDQPRSETSGPTPRSKSRTASKTIYSAYPAGHLDYPTVREISATINKWGVTNTILPQNAVEQLLQVMVYDDKLQKMHRPSLEGEVPDDSEGSQMTMYRAMSTPEEVSIKYKIMKKASNKALDHPTRKSVMRPLEIEDIGHGGITEVPCLRCPVIDLCEDEGPVSVLTCEYLDNWLNLIESEGLEESQRDETLGIGELRGMVEDAKPTQAESMVFD